MIDNAEQVSSSTEINKDISRFTSLATQNIQIQFVNHKRSHKHLKKPMMIFNLSNKHTHFISFFTTVFVKLNLVYKGLNQPNYGVRKTF